MKAISIKTLSYFLLSLVIACFTSISYGSDDLSIDEIIKKAEQYRDNQDYQQAMQWYLKAADKDNANAMFNIGVMYEQGLGVKQDYQQAMQWYLKSANRGNTDAMHNNAVIYYQGYGVTQDKSKAKEWFLKASDLGNVHAQKALKDYY